MAEISLINGPLLNLLGTREPEKYGNTSLPDIESTLQETAKTAGHSLHCFQSNSETALVEHITRPLQDGSKKPDLILINAAAFTHTSFVLLEALLALKVPFVEIHMTNVHARAKDSSVEKIRRQSFLSEHALGIISGFGSNSYTLALEAGIHYLKQTNQ